MGLTIVEIIALTIAGLVVLIPILVFIGRKFSKVVLGKWVTLEQKDSSVDKFIKFFLSYQIDLDELHDKHIETIEEIQEIEYRRKMKDQMGRVEKTLDILRDRVMSIFMEILRKYNGEDINALDMLEYRSFEGIFLLTLSRIKSMFRVMMTENHLSDLSEDGAKEWRKNATEIIIAEAIRGFHKYYPSEFEKPPRSIICKQLFENNKTEFWLLVDITLEATRQIAIQYDEKVKSLKEGYEKSRSCFSAKWKGKIKEIFNEEVL